MSCSSPTLRKLPDDWAMHFEESYFDDVQPVGSFFFFATYNYKTRQKKKKKKTKKKKEKKLSLPLSLFFHFLQETKIVVCGHPRTGKLGLSSGKVLSLKGNGWFSFDSVQVFLLIICALFC